MVPNWEIAGCQRLKGFVTYCKWGHNTSAHPIRVHLSPRCTSPWTKACAHCSILSSRQMFANTLCYTKATPPPHSTHQIPFTEEVCIENYVLLDWATSRINFYLVEVGCRLGATMFSKWSIRSFVLYATSMALSA
jgi:hypothetical protein